jgi:ketosteroid isomerase-like protein
MDDTEAAELHGLAAALRDALERLRRVEDELAIQRLIVRYGFAVDTGDADALVQLFTDDAVYEIDGAYVTGGAPYVMRGHDDLRAMIESERHGALRPRCAHTIGPVCVEVDGDQARAVGYSRVYWGTGDAAELHRLSSNEWQCVRGGDGRWFIAGRRSVSIGSAAAQDVLRAGLGPV